MTTDVIDKTACFPTTPLRPRRFELWFIRIPRKGDRPPEPGAPLEVTWPPARYWGEGPYVLEPNDYDLIAEIEASDVEDVFCRAQNFEQPWCESPEITRIHRKGPHRSMIDGDVVVDLDSGETHLCLAIGWATITDPRLIRE